jgi:hypothetical protein
MQAAGDKNYMENLSRIVESSSQQASQIKNLNIQEESMQILDMKGLNST